MQNSLQDLNNHLFAALERLSDESIANEDLDKELGRTEGIIKVSNAIIGNASVILEAEKLRLKLTSEYGENTIPKFIGDNSGK